MTKRWFISGVNICVLSSACLQVASTYADDEGHGALIRDGRHTFGKHVRTWVELRNQNIVMQQRDFSCGAAALATQIRYFWGDQITEVDILQELDKMLTPEQARDRIQNGLSLTDLRRVAIRMRYMSSIGELEFEKLAEARLPLIVGIKVDGYDHFVVYRGIRGNRVYLADPSRGNIRVPNEQFLRQWQKKLVLVVVKPGAGEVIDSPLQIRLEETDLGQLNFHTIRRHAVKPPNLFPADIRP